MPVIRLSSYRNCGPLVAVFASEVIALDSVLAQLNEEVGRKNFGNLNIGSVRACDGQTREHIIEELDESVALRTGDVLDVVKIHLDVLLEQRVDVIFGDDGAEQAEKSRYRAENVFNNALDAVVCNEERD